MRNDFFMRMIIPFIWADLAGEAAENDTMIGSLPMGT
jgi:hypothetical protein